MTVKYPQIKVKRVDEDGNTYNILARVRYALKQAHIPQSEIDAFLKTATSSDYDNLLRVVMETVVLMENDAETTVLI